MNIQKTLSLSALIAAGCCSGAAGAADVFGGTGIGFSNVAGQWVINVVFDKTDLLATSPVSVHSGQDLTPTLQKGNGVTLSVPLTKSMAWCDPSSNPANPTNTDFEQCYGWAMHSKWAVLDFNKLQQAGLKKVWVSVTVKRYDDGVAVETDSAGKTLPGDDDLVPGLTVFSGRQDMGAHLHWYPNKFQTEPAFWAWKLTPFAGGKTQSDGWATANGPGEQNSAHVMGLVTLKPGGENFLSVAIGGDARHATAAEKHDVNFQLDVQVSRKMPSLGGGSDNGGNGGGAQGTIDQCGCVVGVTQWHASMNHCMAIALCEPIAGTSDQCKTPEMCAKDGGR